MGTGVRPLAAILIAQRERTAEGHATTRSHQPDARSSTPHPLHPQRHRACLQDPAPDRLGLHRHNLRAERCRNAYAQWRRVADQLHPKVPKLALLIDTAKHDVLACGVYIDISAAGADVPPAVLGSDPLLAGLVGSARGLGGWNDGLQHREALGRRQPAER